MVQSETLLLAFDRPAQARRCVHTLRQIRSAKHGNYSGAIELVFPREIMLDVDELQVRRRTLDEILPVDSRGRSFPRQPPQPCASLPQKRLDGWEGYYFKTLVTMSSFWASRYEVVTWIDCGMHVHRPLSRLLEVDPGSHLLALSATWPFKATFSQAHHAVCDPVANRSLTRAYPAALTSDYFVSTLMRYRTTLLGKANEALRSIIALYHRYGALFEGDQDILSLYWLHNRHAWGPLPMDPPHCIFDYAFRVPHPAGCRTLVLSKMTYLESYLEAKARGGGQGHRLAGLSGSRTGSGRGSHAVGIVRRPQGRATNQASSGRAGARAGKGTSSPRSASNK